MKQGSQVFFPKAALEAIYNDFVTENAFKERGAFKGIVFTLGDSKGKPVIYSFPVYDVSKDGIVADTVIYQNLQLRHGGCPYPPPCNPLKEEDSTQTAD